MKYKTILPRLLVEKSEASPGKSVGFLYMRATGKKILIGSPDSREFRLLQCLFSPKNFLSAKYEPVVQTHERVFGAIRQKADALNVRLSNHKSAEDEMATIVEGSLRTLQKGEVGEYFSFFSKEGRVHMAPAG